MPETEAVVRVTLPDFIYDAALAEANELRRRHGLRAIDALPGGEVTDDLCCTCPVAEAVDGFAVVRRCWPGARGKDGCASAGVVNGRPGEPTHRPGLDDLRAAFDGVRLPSAARAAALPGGPGFRYEVVRADLT